MSPPLRSADPEARAGRCGAEVLSRCEPINANLPELNLVAVHTTTMQTGVFMESHLSGLVLCFLSLFLLISVSLAAPGQPGSQREASDVHSPSSALANPFGSGEEDRRLLQSFIQSTLKDGEGDQRPEISTWEQEVFFLFRLYDYDRSGFLDGLEMMKLLFDYNSHHTPGAQANELVVSMVDFLLQTQDLNQDGLLAPSELLSPPLPHKQDSGNNNSPHQEQDVMLEEKHSIDQENTGAAEHKEEPHEKNLPQEEIKIEEEEPVKQVDEHNGQEVPAAEQDQDQDHAVPVHQGQPEI